MSHSNILFTLANKNRAKLAPHAEHTALSAETNVGEPATNVSGVPSRADLFAVIRRSGLFDAAYYRHTNPHLTGTEDELLEHYLDVGVPEHRRPNPYFEARWYLDNYADVAQGSMPPLVHYITHGDSENRWPGPLFNTPWYRARHGISLDQLALAHYLGRRCDGTVSPLPEFDIAYYAKHCPDVIAAKIDAFEHFVSYGFREGRNPAADFDVKWYADRYLSGSLAENPFYHWLAHRGQPGVHGRLPEDEPTVAREVRRSTSAAPDFEELRPLPRTAIRRAKVLAYYLPQFHAFPENDTWWGAGFTEWTNLPRGLPRFKGHYQPRVPRDLGFYSLDAAGQAATMRRQADMARDGGVGGFVFYHYWFNRKRLMAGPLEHLLADPSIDMPFCLMWANENWTRRWDGAESEVLISQDYRADDDEAMVADFARHFTDPRYIRIGGRPLFMIYRPGIIPKAKETIARWRVIWRDTFGENPIIIMAQAFGDTDPRAFGLDGAIEFPPHKLTQHMQPVNKEFTLLDPEFTGRIYHYDAVVTESLGEAPPPFPLIKTVVPSWDNDARRQGAGLAITGSTPAKYEAWLAAVIKQAQATPFFDQPIVCVNAWNEWCEGAYLEPDIHFGAAYLNATGRAVAGLARGEVQADGRLLLVGHDAFPGGAQTLLLKIGRVLRARHGVQFEYLLLDGGRLVPDYEALAPTTVLTGGIGLDGAAAALFERGFTNAIVNTTASGLAVAALRRVGVKSVFLVHELPRLLREKNIVDAARQGLTQAELAIFPARFVRDSVFEELGLDDQSAAKTLVMPQGSYKLIIPSAAAAETFREAHAIQPGEPLVIGIGYADLRKGFDIFLQLWRLMNMQGRVHFCWLGDMDPELKRWLGDEIRLAEQSGLFHMPGQVRDVTPALSAASAFLLTSREDPFPTVALEALSAGLPVVAFAGTGGIPELLVEQNVGFAVPYGDVAAMAAALEDALTEETGGAAEIARMALIEKQFAFEPYVRRVFALAMPELPKISVAVPNYNYARYMPERLGSIFSQTHPVLEVIVLDDRSTDDSLAVIPAVAADWQRDITLVPNEKNSGSVFAQWRKAAELATGEWLWIAEADDSSDPAFLARVMAAAQNDPRVVLAFSDSRTIHVDGSPQWESYKGYYGTVEAEALTRTEVFDGADFAARLLSVKNLLLNVSAVVWRREAFLRALDAVGDEIRTYKMAGDWRLYLQALAEPGVRVAYEATPLNVHRRHAGSVTHALDGERHVDEIARCQKFVGEAVRGMTGAQRETQRTYLAEVRKQLVPDAIGIEVDQAEDVPDAADFKLVNA
jgi:glycosyltransferase involved in cell wall biosynthesis